MRIQLSQSSMLSKLWSNTPTVSKQQRRTITEEQGTGFFFNQLLPYLTLCIREFYPWACLVDQLYACTKPYCRSSSRQRTCFSSMVGSPKIVSVQQCYVLPWAWAMPCVACCTCTLVFLRNQPVGLLAEKPIRLVMVWTAIINNQHFKISKGLPQNSLHSFRQVGHRIIGWDNNRNIGYFSGPLK